MEERAGGAGAAGARPPSAPPPAPADLLDRLDAALWRCTAAAERIAARAEGSARLAAEVRRALADIDALLDRAHG